MNQTPITIITPCYNENVTAIKFLETLEPVLCDLPYLFCIVVVNDCSTDNTRSLLEGFCFTDPKLDLKILNLTSNSGHQTAIYEGLSFAQSLESDHFIIMDSDGEDAPSAIPLLLEHIDADIVNVVRSNRKEAILFRACYSVYKMIFRVVTGKQMNYGNFCLISRRVMEQAVFSNFSHFAAFLAKQKYTRQYIVVKKQDRLGGRSKMSFKKHLRHAILSFAEYKTESLVRP